MEKTAKLILKERKYDSNMKRYQKVQKEETEYRHHKFDQVKDSRCEKFQLTVDEGMRLHQLGYERYKRDAKDVEKEIETARLKELKHARESFLKLRSSMELTERNQRDAIENFNQSAVEAKKTLDNIQRDILRKEEAATRTINKVREKCMNQFDTQHQTYKKFEDLNESRLFNQSEQVQKKLDMTNQKSHDLNERTIMTVEDHRIRNEERFCTRDEGLSRAADQRSEFLKRENTRHKTKVQARERILFSISIDQEQKKEMRRLHINDTAENINRERNKKQQFQDFVLKKEFMKNAFN